MRRWIVLLLLAIFPLQLSIAAAAAYCAQESTKPAANHFGHHEHHGVSQSDNAVGNDDGQLTVGSDADCAFCQLSCSHFIPVDASSPSMPDASMGLEIFSLFVPSRDPEPRERPKWLAPA